MSDKQNPTGGNPSRMYLNQNDIADIKGALKAKNRAQAELDLLMCDLEDKYDFSVAAGDNIDLPKGIIAYARPNNPIESVDTE